jgi:hypothetical protein
MQMRAILIALVACLPFGCGDDGHDATPFTSFQACFDNHTDVELLPTHTAIVVCCLDHPIVGMSPACGDTEADCINYLTANLNQTDASTTQVMDACVDYISQK